MAIDIIQNAMIKAERLATLMVKDQVRASAYKTGNLMQSVSVLAERSGDVVLLVLNDPTTYGDWVDFGTKPNRATTRGPFNPNPGKNKEGGGIIPRFWSTLDDAQIERIQMIFEEEIDSAIEQDLEI
jgi:hypothetical protein